jgi:hypothetical protein
MPQEKPKRSRKSKRITVNDKKDWKAILRDVDTDHVPFEYVHSIEIQLIDGSLVVIDVNDLIKQGHDPRALETDVTNKLSDLEPMIHRTQLFVSLDNVAQTVQPITQQILKDL